jgi:hypothetical protein
MGKMINSGYPRVPNPVDPNEDFADRWSMPECRNLRLEENFWNWLRQAQSDFESLSNTDMNFVAEQAKQKFSVTMTATDLSKQLGLAYGANIIIPKAHVITDPPKPWSVGCE